MAAKITTVTLDTLQQKYNKKYGDGTFVSGADVSRDCPRIPFGIFAVDYSTGGGVPTNRSSCLWGAPCVDQSSKIWYTIFDHNGHRVTRKYVTLRKFYKYFQAKKNTYNIKVPSVNHDGQIFLNTVKDVFYCGFFPCYKLTTNNGLSLVVTENHKFLRGDSVFVPLKHLKVGDFIYTHQGQIGKGRSNEKAQYSELFVKYHPSSRVKYVDKYKYYRIRKNRAVVEAYLNNLSYEEYIFFLNNTHPFYIDAYFKVLSKDTHVHHIDGDINNNSLSNLELIDVVTHGKLHYDEHKKNMGFFAQIDTIKSIEFVGNRQTYDIECTEPHRNYIIQGLVVHNSVGKSTLATYLMKSAASFCYSCFKPLIICTCGKKLKKRAVLVDIEGSFDKVWADHIGLTDEDYYYVQPETGESAVNIAEEICMAEDCGLMVVDTLAFLEPSSELEAAAEEAGYPAQPRLVAKMFRKVTQRLISERKKNHAIAAVFLNQARVKLGGSKFSNNEDQPSGMAAKFAYSLSVRLGARGLAPEEKDKYFDKETGLPYIHKTSTSVNKNKVIILSKTSEYSFVSTPGFEKPIGYVIEDKVLLKYAKMHGVLQNIAGGWEIGKNKYKTLKDVTDTLENNTKLRTAIYFATIKAAKVAYLKQLDSQKAVV